LSRAMFEQLYRVADLDAAVAELAERGAEAET
jgi:hypothetical protein